MIFLFYAPAPQLMKALPIFVLNVEQILIMKILLFFVSVARKIQMALNFAEIVKDL